MRRRVSLAVMLSLGVVLWHHVINTLVLGEGDSFTGHAQYVALGAMLGVPFAFAAIWAAERFVGRSDTGSTWREHAAFAAVASVAFAVLLVPLSTLQMWLQEVISGGGGGGHQHAELAGASAAELADHGLRYAAIAQPVAFLLALLTVGLMVSPPRMDKVTRRKVRTMVIAAATAVVTTAPLTDAYATEPQASDTVPSGGSCSSAPQKVFNVSAINVDVVLDRWGDHDPYGMMYALNSQIPTIRAFEAATNGTAANGWVPTARVSHGLQADPIQPLTLRANLGDCVVVNLTNALTRRPRGGPGSGGQGALRPNATPTLDDDEPANGDDPQPGDGFIAFGNGIPSVSIDVQGVAYQVNEGGSSIGNNPDRMTAPGQTRTYRFYLDPLMGEGGRVFHSGGESEQMTAHGLFGAIIAEPAGSRYFDTRTGAEQTNNRNWSSWDAMILPFGERAFREFAIMYHEVGDENFNVRMSRRASDDIEVFPDPDAETGILLPGNDPRSGNGGRPGETAEPLGWPITMVDSTVIMPSNPPLTGTLSYRPGGKAINYRSEPFWRRLSELPTAFTEPGTDFFELARDKKALGYSSYTYGDPATPIPMSYLGEPTKTRLMHPGSEQLHVHHLHGGGDRWRANPNADNPNEMFGGLNKNPTQNALSIRLDSQTVGPDEAYDLEHECGAGGCQQAAGDFLFHCHIAQHYIAGMFSFWRVFDTNQAGLAPLPNAARPANAVTSDRLIGRTFEGKTIVADTATPTANQIRLRDWVEPQIPPRGVRGNADDATTWDWDRVGNVYRGEPEQPAQSNFANYVSPTPGQRPNILFNPTNGRYAWPLFRPHLGMRPPFSPNGHSGAPWLGEQTSAQRPDGLCPRQPRPETVYNLVAINTPIQESELERDQEGRIFVTAEDKNKVTPTNVEPLAIRSNVGDCVALTLTSELNPDRIPINGQLGIETGQHKVNIHTHFVQFDPQASDGVITGFSYEQSVNTYLREGDQHEGRHILAATAAGATSVRLSDVGGLRVGIFLAVGIGTNNIEIRKITAINATTGTVTLDRALTIAHPTTEFAGVEFMQSRWFSDVDSGTVFFHDHVDGITSWAKGLFAAHIIEPAGSVWLSPTVPGQRIRAGTQAIIQTTGRVGVDQGAVSFREFMLFLHNGRRGRPQVQTGNKLFDFGQACEESSINLRAEPFGERSAANLQRLEWNGGFCGNRGVDEKEEGLAARGPGSLGVWSNDTFNTVDPYVFSSARYGDPSTPLLRAYANDPVVIRTIGLVERVEALRISGHRFRRERFNTSGELMDAATTGISERFDYVLEGGAGNPGDYLYYSTRNFALASGGWGIFRVYGERQGDEAGETTLVPLPDRAAPPTAPGFPRIAPNSGNPRTPTAGDDGNLNPCPTNAPVRRYNISIFNLTLPTGPNVDPDPDNNPATNDAGQNQDRSGVIYSLSNDMAAIKANPNLARPLVLRANQGECVQVTLNNRIDDAGRKTFDPGTTDRGLDYGGDTGGTRASFELAKLRTNVQQSGGGAVGLNPDTSVARGQSRTYTFFADRELGTSIFQNLASPASVIHGAYGLFIVEPQGSTWSHSGTGARFDNVVDANGFNTQTDIEAIIRGNLNTNNFREFALTMSTTDQHSARSVVPYWDTIAGTGEVSANSENPGRTRGGAFMDPNNPITIDRIQPGFNNLNYHTANVPVRLDRNGNNLGQAFRNVSGNGDPATAVFRANAGDRTVIRVGIPATNQFHMFNVGGHVFPWEPHMWNDQGDFRSQLLTSRAITSGETLEVELVGGAGTRLRAAGDYFIGDQRDPLTRAGLWGILRVVTPGSSGAPARL